MDTFKFDKSYNNFWDPEVLKTYVTNVKKTWRNSYGFPHTYPIRWDGKSFFTSNVTKCHSKCALLVSRHHT